MRACDRCLLELYAAVQNNVPLIMLRIENAHAGDVDEISNIFDDLPEYLAKINPTAQEVLTSEGTDAATIGSIVKVSFV